MADKPKPKNAARGKAKSAKPAASKAAKPAEAAAAPAKKGKASKAGASKPPKAKAGKASATQSQAQLPGTETYYVYTEVLPIEIRDTPPSGQTRFVEFSSFDDAREHLLEHLIELIEHHERVLHAIRRAETFADYLDRQGQFRTP
jgi:hypothetical protein